MSDRERRLRQLAEDLRAHESVRDAFTAKGFTDLLVVLDVRGDDTVPDDVRRRLAEHDRYGASDASATMAGLWFDVNGRRALTPPVGIA